MKVKTWIPLVLAVVLGLAALKLTRDAMSRKDGNGAGGESAAVVTATRDIEPGQRITPADLATTRMPVASVPMGTFQESSALVDRVAVSRVAEGQPVLDSALAPPDTVSGMQALIPKGMRAITLRVDEFSGVAGLLVPGSKVDVIAVIGNDAAKGSIARTIVQNVEVRAVGRRVSAAPPPTQGGDGGPMGLPPANNVTLLVTPQQAETLQLASISGTPWLVLRNAKDGAALDSEGTNLADLRGARGAGVPQPVTTPDPVRPAVNAMEKHASAAPLAGAPKSRTVRIIRATKEESVQVEVPLAPPVSATEWLTTNDDEHAAGE